MTVTILIPIYGVEQYIADCAESLFAQTYPDIEYVFCDDSTPDCSVRVLERPYSDSRSAKMPCG